MSVQLGLSLLILVASGCEAPVEMPLEAHPERAAAGSPRSVIRLAHYPSLKSRAILWMACLSDVLPVESSATLYRLEYWTTDPDGELTHASGLVAIPGKPPFWSAIRSTSVTSRTRTPESTTSRSSP